MDIHEFRKQHARITRIRDGDTCQYCRNILGLEGVPASDVHHVLGRSAIPASRETHNFLLCLCRRHHRDFHDTLERHIVEKVMAALEEAKENPVEWNYLKRYGREKLECNPNVEPIGSILDLHDCIAGGKSASYIEVDGYLLCRLCLKWFERDE